MSCMLAWDSPAEKLATRAAKGTKNLRLFMTCSPYALLVIVITLPNGRASVNVQLYLQHCLGFCNYTYMSKRSNVKTMLPGAVERHLALLGEHIHIARKRRKQSLATWAERVQVSVPTLRKMEAGDPTVSVAAYATALWLIGRVHLLSEIANPSTDELMLLQELKGITKNRQRKGRLDDLPWINK